MSDTPSLSEQWKYVVLRGDGTSTDAKVILEVLISTERRLREAEAALSTADYNLTQLEDELNLYRKVDATLVTTLATERAECEQLRILVGEKNKDHHDALVKELAEKTGLAVIDPVAMIDTPKFPTIEKLSKDWLLGGTHQYDGAAIVSESVQCLSCLRSAEAALSTADYNVTRLEDEIKRLREALEKIEAWTLDVTHSEQTVSERAIYDVANKALTYKDQLDMLERTRNV